MLVDAIERAVLLHTLECVSPGLSPHGVVEQSGSFIFREGTVLTYNEEVCCRAKSGFPIDFTGAVRSKAFVDLLRKLKDDVVRIDVEAGVRLVVLGGGRRRARLNMDAEITIPLGDLEVPGKKDWQPAHEEFNDAVSIVQNVAGSDNSQFVGTCVHIHPKWVEATDGYQLARYSLQTGVKERVLVKRDALKHVVQLDVTRVCETPKWIHFKNPAGVTLSCRRHLDEYPDLKPNLAVDGVPAALPKGLSDAICVASIFSKENADSNLLIVALKPGTKKNLMVTGVGVSGDYSEIGDVVYDGPPIKFTIPPEILTEITSKHSECVITQKRLKVEGGKWKYVTTLGTPDEAPPPTAKDTKEQSNEEITEAEEDSGASE